ncbi:MAG: phosphatase PAP2 family protein [Candidatus Zixiibacteriota bacterium]
MLDVLIGIDTWLLLKLNAGAANPVFDAVMPIVTNIRYWRIPILIYFAALILFGGGKGRSAVLVAIVLFTITDQLSSHVLKDWIGRLRPCHVVEGVRILDGCGGSKSMPSGHATNTMAAAIFFGLTFRRWFPLLLGLSLLVSYSRIYMGIHYPGDLLAGWMLGGGIAWGMLYVQRRYLQRHLERLRPFRPRWSHPKPDG